MNTIVPFRVPDRVRPLALWLGLILCIWQGKALAQHPLSITDQALPPFNAGVDIRVPLHATGGVPPYSWILTGGSLPDGVFLDPAGCLCGRPTKTGTFALRLTVTDSARPAHTINKDFTAVVTSALLLDWVAAPRVDSTHINGAIQVSNSSRDDFDLTVIVMAVNEIGRATALRYEHFTLRAGRTNFQIAFDSSLPRGAYVVHADAVAEIPAKTAILRQRLETPSLLQVSKGP